MIKYKDDSQQLFENYLKINEDLGLGPRQNGTNVMKMPTVGSTGNVGKSHMDPAKSNLTPSSEDAEDAYRKATDINQIIDDIINNLDFIRTLKGKRPSLNMKLLLQQVQSEVDRIVELSTNNEIN